MRIALNMGNLRGFGSRQVGQGVLRSLADDARDELAVWVPRQWGWSADEIGARHRLAQVNTGIVPKFIGDNISLRRHLLKEQPDCLFSLGDTSIIGCNVPHLLLVQQAYLAYRPDQWDFPLPKQMRAKMAVMSVYFRLCLPTVSHLTVQTESMKTRLCERWGLSPSRVTVVPSAIEIDARARWRPDSDVQPYLLYVASASPHKNFEILAPMMASLPASLSDMSFKLTVRPEEVPELVARARRLGVLDRFEFMGRVHNVAELMAGARAVVMPSRLESFGLPYYEAMAVGCPLVVADRDFAREACGEAALYAAADSGEEFARHVDALLGSNELSVELSHKGRVRYEERRVSWSEVGASYRDLLMNLTSNSMRQEQ